MGRSRGGLTTKVHALTDARGLPIKLALTPGQALLLTDLPRGAIVLGDKAYDADWIRKPSRPKGPRPTFPTRSIGSITTASPGRFTRNETKSNGIATSWKKTDERAGAG